MRTEGCQGENRGFRDDLYADYVSGHQGEVAERLSERSLESHVITRIPEDPRIALMDVGCGQGQLVDLLQRQGFMNARGIDRSPEQVALAHRLGRRTVELGDLFDIASSEPASYDVVTAIDVIEHFDRDHVQRVFQAFSDLLRPGGLFIFRTPNGGGPFSGRLLYSDLSHGIIYTQRSLEQVSHLTGFASVASYPVRPSGASIKGRIRAAAWILLEPLLKLPLILDTGVVRGHLVTQNLVGVATKAGGP